jgi:hypothetical protein
MDVHIQEVVATVRAINSDTLLTQRTLSKIVTTVLTAARAERADEQRRKTDRRVTNGARDEQEGEAG